MAKIKLTPEEKQNLAEFNKAGRRIRNKSRFTDKMLAVIKPLYNNPYFEDYLKSEYLFFKYLKNRADYYQDFVDSYTKWANQNKDELKTKDITEDRKRRLKDDMRRNLKTAKRNKKEVAKYKNSTVLPKQFNIIRFKSLTPAYYTEILMQFSTQHKETVKKRSMERFFKLTPVYSQMIRPKLEKILDSWKDELNKELYDSTLIRVEHLKNRMQIGDLTGDSFYLKYLNHKSDFKFHKDLPGRRRSVISMIGSIRKERIKKDTKEIVQNNIDNFLGKMAMKLRWLEKAPTRVSVKSGEMRGIFNLTLHYDKPLVLQTSYETAWSSLGNPFVRFPTRFKIDGKMKSMSWVADNFEKLF